MLLLAQMVAQAVQVQHHLLQDHRLLMAAVVVAVLALFLAVRADQAVAVLVVLILTEQPVLLIWAVGVVEVVVTLAPVAQAAQA